MRIAVSQIKTEKEAEHLIDVVADLLGTPGGIPFWNKQTIDLLKQRVREQIAIRRTTEAIHSMHR